MTERQSFAGIGAVTALILTWAVTGYAGVAEPPLPSLERGPRSFQVFEALDYANQPDLAAFGMQKVRNAERFWPPGDPKNSIPTEGIQRVFREIGAPGRVVFIDIEHWPIYDVPSEQRRRNLDKLFRVVELARQAAPECVLGFYGIMPHRAYREIVRGDPAELRNWREANEHFRTLADRVDVIFPSLYTLEDNPQEWARFARTLLVEAKRYGKPVYAFLWPEFHDGNHRLRGRNIPASFWREQLELCRRYADGVVLWGGWTNVGPKGADRWRQQPWVEDAEWWRETKRFLHELTRERNANNTG